MDVKDKVLL